MTAASTIPRAVPHLRAPTAARGGVLAMLPLIAAYAPLALVNGAAGLRQLPRAWRLEDFDFDAQHSLDPALLRDLATCRYTTDATNLLFIGPPGVGKTMLAIALGHAAVDAGLRTYYTAADLAARCRRAAVEGRWATTMRFFNGPRCSSWTNSATCRCPPKTPTPCSKLSASDTSAAV